MAGRPKGAVNKDKPWAEALRMVAFQATADGRRRLLSIAERCVTAAEQGDLQAIKEIGDRLDGKAHQTVESSSEVVHRYVARVPDKAKTVAEWQEQQSQKTIQ
jgi:hypothetical protein